MKVDPYTKIILTIIAVCLIVIITRDIRIIPEVQAVSDRGDNVVKIQIVSIDESPNLNWEAIPVKIER